MKVLQAKTVVYLLAVFLFLIVGARRVAAAEPPAPPGFPPLAPATTTEEVTNDSPAVDIGGEETDATASAASTASGTSSGPKEIVAIVGLALVAVFSLKKYHQSRKYSL